MPGFERKGRARKKADEPAIHGEALHAAIRSAAGDAEAWAALRPRAIRGLAGSRLTVEQAARIADAYWRTPMFIPGPPPTNFQPEQDHDL